MPQAPREPESDRAATTRAEAPSPSRPRPSAAALQRVIGNRALGQLLAQRRGRTLQRVKGLGAPAEGEGAQVRVFRVASREIVAASAWAKPSDDRAYDIAFDGAEDRETVDQTYVFPADHTDEQIQGFLRPLLAAVTVAGEIKPGEARLRAYDTAGLGETDPVAKTAALLNRPALPPQTPADEVALDALQVAKRFLEIHPLTDANGRTALHLVYTRFLEAGYELELSALELHGVILGEEQQGLARDEPDAFVGDLAPHARAVEDDFDREAFLGDRLGQLKTLQADREVAKAQREQQRRADAERREAERPRLARAQAAAFTTWRDQASEPQKEAVGLLLERGVLEETTEFGRQWFVVDLGKIRQAKSALATVLGDEAVGAFVAVFVTNDALFDHDDAEEEVADDEED